jgi:hypothetical protein
LSETIDMLRFVEGLVSRPKARAAMVMTHDYATQKAWAADLAIQTAAEHLHLLDRFSEDLELAGNLSRFSIPHFFEFLPKQCSGKVLIVSGMEFLKATWSGQASATQEIARRIQTWNRSPCLLFVLQFDEALASYDFGTRYQYQFIVDQKETYQL